MIDLIKYRNKFYTQPNQSLLEENLALEKIIFGIDLKGKKCLDFGCGIGSWIPPLLNRGAKRITGIDVSADALKSCSKEYPGCNFLLSEGEFPSIEDNNYDFIMANWALQELTVDNNFNNILSEFERILKNNGLLLISENVYPDNRKLIETTSIGDIFENNELPPRLRFFKNNTLVKILNSNFCLIYSEECNESFFELYKYRLKKTLITN
jgi:ubiquinone/menaquinone biosynthesis C-methylase UbiE